MTTQREILIPVLYLTSDARILLSEILNFSNFKIIDNVSKNFHLLPLALMILSLKSTGMRFLRKQGCRIYWHDLKRCAITWILDNGYSDRDLINLGIQYTPSMIDRYYKHDSNKVLMKWQNGMRSIQWPPCRKNRLRPPRFSNINRVRFSITVCKRKFYIIADF